MTSSSTYSSRQWSDRRQYVRIAAPYRACVALRDDNHRKVITTTIRDLGAGGLYFYMDDPLNIGDYLTVVVLFSTRESLENIHPLRVAVRGSVLRVEPLEDGRYGVAIRIEQHRLF